MRVGTGSDMGMIRASNQDVAFSDADLGLFAVADGMGGHNGGEIASRTAVEALKEYPWSQINTSEDLRGPFSKANAAVWQMAESNSDLAGMGTTLTLAKVVGDTILIGHIGDSRGYLIGSDGTAHQLTDDHSVVGELVRNGSITVPEARVHPQRNLLTKALGTRPDVTVDVISLRPGKSDVVLLCTDGLVNELEPEEIADTVVRNCNLQVAAEQLISLAKTRGGRDNITVVMFSLD